MTDHEHPTVIFDSEDAEFMRGVTIGTLYGVMAGRPDLEFHFMIGRDNVENLLRVTEALGRSFNATGDECDSGCHLEFHVDKTAAYHQ